LQSQKQLEKLQQWKKKAPQSAWLLYIAHSSKAALLAKSSEATVAADEEAADDKFAEVEVVEVVLELVFVVPAVTKERHPNLMCWYSIEAWEPGNQVVSAEINFVQGERLFR
jgi:hypothetical protein